jgi:hypothetical protein
MSEITLGCIVEGQGDATAAPVLIRRLAASIDPACRITISPPRRIPKSKLVRPGELERSVEALARQIGRAMPILIVIDADTDCPKDLAYDLVARCRATHGDISVSTVVAKMEYETWFIAAAESLSGRSEFAHPLTRPDDPESIRGAKEWLSRQMKEGHRYVETRHQAAYSAVIDIAQAMTIRSFQKLAAEVRRIVERFGHG